MKSLKRFWVNFEFSKEEICSGKNIGLEYGCGVTAYDWGDALNLLQNNLFFGEPLPIIKKVAEDIDVSTLDKSHVLPNIGISIIRGIWFPNLSD